MEIIKEPKRPYPRTDKVIKANVPLPRGTKIPLQNLSFLGGSRRRKGRKLIEFQFLSSFIDGLIILGVTLLLTAGYLSLFKNEGSRNSFFQIFAVVFFWFQFCYLVLLRTFAGCTLGEKTCHIRLGLYQERFLLSYPFRVIYRTLLILITGVILLPILSWFFEKDLAGEVTDLKIISLV